MSEHRTEQQELVMEQPKPRRRVEKSKGHQRYRTKNGTIVPGCTTVINVLDKPALVRWANRLGLDGIDSTTYTDELKDAGTLVHAMVQADLEGWEVDTSEFSQDMIDHAETGFLKYLDWKAQHDIEVLGCEMQLVSERFGYGGTLDIYCNLDGYPMLVDGKTGKRIYDEVALQLSALRQLLHENGYDVGKPDRCAVLRLGRNESEGFEFRQIALRKEHWQMYKACLDIYRLKKELF